MYSAFILILLHLTIVLSRNITEKEWNDYKVKFNKKYTPAEDEMRKQIYSENVNIIDKHNEMYAQGKFTYTKGINQFTDMTQKEFEDNYLIKIDKLPNVTDDNVFKPSGGALMDEINWVTRGAVTPVKNQLQCGACWTFSTTGALEGANFIRNGQLISLSEQQILDCDLTGEGCTGGNVDRAYQYLMQVGGSETEESYAYVAKQETCQFNAASVGVRVDTYKLVQGEEYLDAALNQQPVAIYVDATNWATYSGGIFEDSGSESTDHAVLLVGTGSDNGIPYWLVKNSWGTYWGEAGYIRILKGRGICGIGSFGCVPYAA